MLRRSARVPKIDDDDDDEDQREISMSIADQQKKPRPTRPRMMLTLRRQRHQPRRLMRLSTYAGSGGQHYNGWPLPSDLVITSSSTYSSASTTTKKTTTTAAAAAVTTSSRSILMLMLLMIMMMMMILPACPAATISTVENLYYKTTSEPSSSSPEPLTTTMIATNISKNEIKKRMNDFPSSSTTTSPSFTTTTKNESSFWIVAATATASSSSLSTPSVPLVVKMEKISQPKIKEKPTTTTTTTTPKPVSKPTTIPANNDNDEMRPESKNNKSGHIAITVGRLTCEYGTIRKYIVSTVVHSKLSNGEPLAIRATLVTKCLNQISWGPDNGGLLQDESNGQKFLAIVGDFHISLQPGTWNEIYPGTIATATGNGGAGGGSIQRSKRSKRGLYRYISHLWKDFKNILTTEHVEDTLPRDEFDADMMASMENEIETQSNTNRKCHYVSNIPDKYWDGPPPTKHWNLFYATANERCITCPNANPFAKLTLPFWFIQLEDGTIPQIRFSKQETNTEIKNWKKYLTSLLATQLNTSVTDALEMTWPAAHRSRYSFSVPDRNHSHISDRDLIRIGKHIKYSNFDFELNQKSTIATEQQQDELKMVNSKNPPVAVEVNQTNTFDSFQATIIDSAGNASIFFDGQNDLYASLECDSRFDMKMSRTIDPKYDDTLKVLSERFVENTKETLVAQIHKRETILYEKYTRILARLRSKLGKNEYRYYTTLYESATSNLDSPEHDSLLELISLEQQLNHTVHQHNSIIGDIRRIGTAHNIQLACGVNMANVNNNEKCIAFIFLLLKSSSKTAQRDLLYALQNVNNNKIKKEIGKVKISVAVARLLSHTNKPSRWFIENLLHEAYHPTDGNIELEATLLQSLTLLAQNEQLSKLTEMLSGHIVKRIFETLTTTDGALAEPRIELFLVDLIKMLGNLDNYTAIESVQKRLMRQHESTLLTIATIHAYRRSINRSQVQSYLGELFQNGSCQIKQEIVQLLIDNVDLIFLEQTTDKRWPEYSFNQLDQILAQHLRNSSNNCVHHLILEYFRRKVNHKASDYIKEYENHQNYDSSSFDFCINESLQVKCDYVQKIGTEMISMLMRKSISIPKIMFQPNISDINDSAINSSSRSSIRGYIFTKYSIDLNFFKYKLTLGHLNVIQNLPDININSSLHLEFDSYRGQTIPVARLELQSFNGTVDNNNETFQAGRIMAQVKINIPDIIVWAERYLHFDYSLLMQVDLLLTLKLIPPAPDFNNNNNNSNSETNTELHHRHHRLQINFDIKTSAEMLSTSLVTKNSIELKSQFNYESTQPLAVMVNGPPPKPTPTPPPVHRSQRIRTINGSSVVEDIVDIAEPIPFEHLGNEWFHHEIELFKEFNKRYEPQCNTWMDESYKQTLSLWNSTLVQKNLLSLSLLETGFQQQQQQPALFAS